MAGSRSNDAVVAGAVSGPEGVPTTAGTDQDAAKTDGIVWEDPPMAGGQRGSWITLLAPLMARPGQWARVSTRDNRHAADTKASQLRHRRLQIPSGRWEFAARGVAIYARYLGPDNGEAK